MTSVLYSGTEDRSICPSQVVALRYLCWLLYLKSASYFILVAVYLFICPHPVVPMSPPSQIPPTSLAHPDPVSSVGSHCKQLFGKSEYICLWILNCCSFTTAASLTQHEPVQVDIKKIPRGDIAVSEIVHQWERTKSNACSPKTTTVLLAEAAVAGSGYYNP